jgi:Kef-type K+ transport system membrane component KefB
MHESLLTDIGKSIFAAALLGLPAYLLRIPLLLAYLIAGVILGPALGLGLIQKAESISILSEIGLILLMFILGLEINIRKLVHAGKAVLICGALQFIFCLLLAMPFFKFTGLSVLAGKYGLQYLCVAAALSSTLIVVKILSDRMELDALASRITIGVLVIQDLWAIVFLAIQPNISNMGAVPIAISISKAILLVFVCLLLAKYILPRIFRKIGLQPELMIVTAMAWCFAVCGAANQMHLSLEMGALVAGVTIASFPYHIDIASKLSSLRDFFITLFFVSLGLQIPVPTLAVLELSAGIMGFVLVSRIFTVFPILHRLGYGNWASLLPAVNLSQLSEFAIVLGALGKTYGHISDELLSAFIISMVGTALLSSGFIPRAHSIYRFLNPFFIRIGFRDDISHTTADMKSSEHGPQLVMLGFFRQASSLLTEMVNRHSPAILNEILIVDLNPEAHHKLKEMGAKCRYGDISHLDTLRGLNLENAKIIVVTNSDHQLKGITNHRLLKTLKGLAPNATVIVTAETFNLARECYNDGADYVFIPRLVGAHYLADVLERIKSGEGPGLKTTAHNYVKSRKEILP